MAFGPSKAQLMQMAQARARAVMASPAIQARVVAAQAAQSAPSDSSVPYVVPTEPESSADAAAPTSTVPDVQAAPQTHTNSMMTLGIGVAALGALYLVLRKRS